MTSLLHTCMSNLSMSILCICHPHFALFIHIEPLAEEAVYAEQEPIVQELDEEPAVVQQPQEEQLYEEPQRGHDYVPEATRELTTDLSKVGTLSIILRKSCLTIVCRLCIKCEELIETHLHRLPPYLCPFDTYLS